MSSVMVGQGLTLHTDLGDEDARIHDCFDVLQPAWALQTFQEIRHGGGPQLTDCNHNTAASPAGSNQPPWKRN